MKVKFTKPVNLTGVETAPGTIADVTPEFGRELIEKGQAEELGIIRQIKDKIEKAIETKGETRKTKDN